MSCYETRRGKLKLVETNDVREFLASKVNSGFEIDDDDTITDIIYNNDLYEKYVYFNNRLYEWIEHKVKYDEEDDFCNLTENSDGTISVHVQFYNGGACLIDMLEDNKNRIKQNDMLTADQMIDVACKWLDYHHSDYIVDMQYGSLVSGACQTDLRAFLNSAKKMEYWDAINAAKS